MYDRIFAWHFLSEDKKLSGGKWKNPIVRPEVSYVHKGSLKPQISGLHASKLLLDALEYANGSIVTRVECSDRVSEHTFRGPLSQIRPKYSKILVCGRRKVMWMQDIAPVLHEFSLWCAERISTHPILQAKRDWLQGSLTTLEFCTYRDDLAMKPETAAWDLLMSAVQPQSWLAAKDTSHAVLEQLIVSEVEADRHMQNDILVRGANEHYSKCRS